MTIDTQVMGTTQQSPYLWYTYNNPDAYPSTKGWQPTYGNVDSETKPDTFGPFEDIACACWSDQTFVAIGLNIATGNLYFALRQSNSWPQAGCLNDILELQDPVLAVACTVDSSNTLYVCAISDPVGGGSPYLWFTSTSDYCQTWNAATTVSTGTLGQLYRFYGLTCAISPVDGQLHCVTLHRAHNIYHFSTLTPPTANSWQYESMPALPPSTLATAASLAAGPLEYISFPPSTDLVVFAVTQYEDGLWYASHTPAGWTSFTTVPFATARHTQYMDVSCALAGPNQDTKEYLLNLFALDRGGTPYYMYYTAGAFDYDWYASLDTYVSPHTQTFTALAATSWAWPPQGTDDEDDAADEQDVEDSDLS